MTTTAYGQIVESSFKDLTPIQAYQALMRFGRQIKVWKVGGYPAICASHHEESTHWWQENHWKKVTFLTLTETHRLP